MTKKLKKRLRKILIGAALFVVAILANHLIPFVADTILGLILFLAAYFVIGGDVIKKACMNIAKGQVFDENFLMLIATVGAFFVGEYHEAAAVMLFYQVGEWFQAYAVNNSRKSIKDLMNIRPDYAIVLRDGAELRVTPEDVIPGELILVKPGEKIPLDGIVVSGNSSINTAALTGESVPSEKDTTADIDEIASSVDFVFCAVDMKKDEIKALEEAYAKAECPVVSNNSANRFTPDVPMIVPEINGKHCEVIASQKERLGTKRGFIAVKSNCSLQSYVPALYPLDEKFGVEDVLVCTYQAISGAGKTFKDWPEMVENIIPYIGGEEEKSEQEPLRIWGKVVDGDKLIAIISKHMRDKGQLRNDTAVVTVMSNLGFHTYMKNNNLSTVCTAVGDRYVLEEMLKSGYNIGGEQSGHIIFLDYATTGDGQLTAVQLITMMNEVKTSLSQLTAGIEDYPQLLVNVKITESGKNKWDKNEAILAAIKDAENAMGDSGRVLVRESGTEPLVRVMLEGRNADEVDYWTNKIADVVREQLC